MKKNMVIEKEKGCKRMKKQRSGGMMKRSSECRRYESMKNEGGALWWKGI